MRTIRRPDRSDLGRDLDKLWSPRSTQVNCWECDAVFGWEAVRQLGDAASVRHGATYVLGAPHDRAADGTGASV